MSESLNNDVLKMSASTVVSDGSKLPEITPDTYHEFVGAQINPNFVANQLAAENPALLQFIHAIQANVDAACQNNANSDNGPGLVDIEGQPIIGPDGLPIKRKMIGLSREDALNLTAQMVFATYRLLDMQLKKDE